MVPLILLLFCGGVLAQEPPSTTGNPLDALIDQVKRVLDEAHVPFTEEQEHAIVLMMEERRQASEDLFGDLLNFRAGPTQAQQADQLRSAIEWMRGEFVGRLQDYLTGEQLAAWNRSQNPGGLPTEPVAVSGRTPAAQTQYVRINNNPFTAEDPNFRFGRGGGGGDGGNFQGGGQNQNRGGGGGGNQGGGGNANRTEVFQRGGAGAWHGNGEFLFKDEALNARNAFAPNRPAYQERQASVDVGGPLLPGRLTTNFSASQSEAENVSTIRATQPDGIFALGITRPRVEREINIRNTYQLSTAHSVSVNTRYRTNASSNQGIGGFNLLERASASTGNNWNVDMRQFSTFSSRSIYEARFNINGNGNETIPLSEALQINVLDAFNSGGAQNASDNRTRNYNFGTMFTRLGEKLTLKAGLEGVYRTDRSFSTGNFVGRYTFSTLYDYCGATSFLGVQCQRELQTKFDARAEAQAQGSDLEITPKPAANFRVNRGNPLVETTQLELSFFVQNDYKLTPRFTLMYGARYDRQTNLEDANNLAPRVGFAYAVGRATVIRGGAGMFYQTVSRDVYEVQRRLDGTTQYEIVVDNPSFPDPFQAGTIRNTFPSVRVTDPNLVAPYSRAALVSLERTFLSTLFLSAQYDISRETSRLRNRNLNAPLPSCVDLLPLDATTDQITACRPFPGRGNIVNLEATGVETAHNLRVNYRQRFSIFNVTANYTMTVANGDSLPSQAVAFAAGGGNNNNNNNNNFIATSGFGSELLPSNNYDLQADYARASYPLHSLGATVNAQLPLGVFLTGAMSTSSGRPYTITTGRDDNRDTTVNDRPDGVARNSAEGPRYLGFDFNISKAFFLGGPGNGGTRKNLNVFANMTNAFNRTNFGVPSGVMTSPYFGRSTSAQNPREIEVGLRLQF